MQISRRSFFLVLMIVSVLSTAASAGSPSPSLAGEARRSHGDIDVILYQTSW
jgi:hypothetical protein